MNSVTKVVLVIVLALFLIAAFASSAVSTTTTPTVEPTTTVSTPTTNTPPAIFKAHKIEYRGAPYLRKGMTKKTVRKNVTKKRPFRVRYKYTYGPKNRLIRWTFHPTYNKRPYKRKNSAKTGYVYREKSLVIVRLGNGRTRAGKWNHARVSWYGPGFYGNTMAGGGTLTRDSMVVAHKTMPFGTRIEFSYRGRRCIAVVRDRGPYVHGRVFDLGPGTARKLGFSGVGTVKYRILK